MMQPIKSAHFEDFQPKALIIYHVLVSGRMLQLVSGVAGIEVKASSGLCNTFCPKYKFGDDKPATFQRMDAIQKMHVTETSPV